VLRLRFPVPVLPLIGLLVVLTGAAMAQTPAAPAATDPSAALDRIHASLTQIETTLERHDLSDATLQQLQADVAPLTSEAQAIQVRLAPRLAAIKVRLDQIGPAPKDGAAPESAALTTERADQMKAFASTDALIKRANLIEVQTTQADTAIAARRRALFTSALLERTTSLLNPALWVRVAHELPGDVRATRTIFGDWLASTANQLMGWRLAAFLACILVVLGAYWPLWRIAHALVRRPLATTPGRLRRALQAWFVVAVMAALPIALVLIAGLLFAAFELSSNRLDPLAAAILQGVARVAMAGGLAQGLLAPAQPERRLIAVSTRTAWRLVQLAVTVALLVSATRVMEAVDDLIGASLNFSVATRGLGALAVALVLAFGLRGIVTPEADEPADSPQRRNWGGALRLVAWIAVVAVMASCVVGLVALASFIIDQIVWLAAVGSGLALAIFLVDALCEVAQRPETGFGHMLVAGVGIGRGSLAQLAVLLDGLGRAALILVALLLALAPWGIQSDDWRGSLVAVLFGVKIGEVTISLVGIAGAIAIFLATYGIARGMQSWLENRFLPLTQLDLGLRNSISTIVGYVGFVVATALALAYLGLDFQKLAIVAGALSVGIGFGLQSIVNNFVSGLIILWERAVRVGDWIVVGADQGFVRRINVRSTEIETFDRASVIIPNSNLITGVVRNLMRTDRVGRVTIDITSGSLADPEHVRETLIEIARAHEGVLSLPAPQVRFIELTPANFKFELLCFVADVETSLRIKSDLNFEIYRQFSAKKYFDGPAPATTVVDLVGLDRIEALLGRAPPPKPTGD
jgi:small-conductance mechanosensitive channel